MNCQYQPLAHRHLWTLRSAGAVYSLVLADNDAPCSHLSPRSCVTKAAITTYSTVQYSTVSSDNDNNVFLLLKQQRGPVHAGWGVTRGDLCSGDSSSGLD